MYQWPPPANQVLLATYLSFTLLISLTALYLHKINQEIYLYSKTNQIGSEINPCLRLWVFYYVPWSVVVDTQGGATNEFGTMIELSLAEENPLGWICFSTTLLITYLMNFLVMQYSKLFTSCFAGPNIFLSIRFQTLAKRPCFTLL